jgi:hypothetical protein
VQADELISELFDDWAARYARGESPDPRSYLERAGDEREALALLMERFLQAAPRAAPREEDVELMRAWMRGDSPLAELRARRGLRRDDLVDAILGCFALRPGQRPAVKEYYHRLESGLIDPAGLSSRLRDLIAERLGVGADVIAAWRPRRIAASAAYRSMPSEGVAYALASRASLEQVEDDEEVRNLFLSPD